ncbi:DUF202 domain-containing protein [Mycobacterium simiae]|uniref:DUF202 domain-containing protein n=1 Tax=Mycobacterium simiae TaxID=1784 RepID=UPI000421335A|nr:DUF202 domain-containing protein [Mycobacterium simiae]PLV49929.1 hypothetical protein X011_13920 [Mycobacterium tuberculosis variant microti OV254]BBX39462.1 hypothetical protein MSIM_09130 [Mycobacterium simiae]
MTEQQLIDVGAQAERTALAWQRTAIGAIAVAALVLRWDALDHLPMWPGIVLAIAAGATVVSFASGRYRSMLHAMAAHRTPVSRRMVPAATVAMTAVILGIGAELAAAGLG